MVGTCHPFWTQVKEFAIAGHEKMKPVVLVAWDIAMTPNGSIALEVNFPPGLPLTSKCQLMGSVTPATAKFSHFTPPIGCDAGFHHRI